MCRLATQAQDSSGLRDPEASTPSTGHTTTEGLEHGPWVSDSLVPSTGLVLFVNSCFYRSAQKSVAGPEQGLKLVWDGAGGAPGCRGPLTSRDRGRAG